MHFKRNSIVILIVLSLVIGLSMTSVPNMNFGAIQCPPINTGMETTFQNINELNDKHFTISQTTENGIIEPVAIGQSGYQTTSLSRGRTDTGTNTQGNITIDDANGWFVNQTEIEVTDLARLYGVNGTFDDGTDPWIAYSYDGGSNTQINSYNSSEGYVVCRNMGQYFSLLGGYYRHSESTEVGWAQVATNIPESLDFRLEFEFRYTTGPIDPDGDDSFDGDIGVFWQLGTEGYYYPMQELDSRNTWYSVSHDFSVAPGTSTFSIYLGLYIAVGNVRVYINQDYDDDPLGEPDGEANAQNVTVCIDNVEFTGITPPGFDVVDLTFHAGGLSSSVTGTGTGVASITNPDYWTADPLEYQVTSNTSVAFTYSITSLFQRYINSSWSTSLNNRGVAYSIASGQSSNLTFYTYVTQSSTYQDATIDIVIPSDWENATIWDPLMNDITGLCEVTQGRIHVPTSELSRSGWWEINLNGLNYIQNTSVQVFDHSLSTWSESSLFRPGNDTRVQLEIGTLDTIPEGGSPTNISWLMPDESPWTVDSVTTMIDGAVTSSVWTFGSTNTTAGEWSIDILWANGTEIAFAAISFALFHSASISATYPIIEADYGLTISNLITLRDADTEEYLLDDSVTMEANWSSAVIPFSQNYAKNWWEADLDTTVIGSGSFVVVVNASRPYFDAVATQFTVISVFQTSLEILNAGSLPIQNGLNEIFRVQLSYGLLNGTGVVGATPTIMFSGPVGGLAWHSFTDNNNGSYSLDIVCSISEIYEVTITFSKPFHHNSSDSFTLIINKTGTELEILNGTADVVQFGDSYRLVVEYTNSTGQGLAGADVQILTITPETGMGYTNFTPIADGYYEIILTPSTTGTFSIVINASLFNHETQYATFTLTGVVVPSVLTSLPSSTTITVNQSFTLQLSFHDEELNPIDTAIITVLNPPSGISISAATSIGNGLYNITIISSEIDVYSLLFRASATDYQSAIVGFTVSVTALPTTLEILNAGSIPIENGLNEIFTVQMDYGLLNGTGVAGALPSFVYSGPDNGLSWTNFVDSGNGLYSLDIACNVSGTYGITITLSKPYYYNTTDSFTLIIGLTGSELELLNGTADVVLYGNSYRLVVEYRNSTGWGLFGAVLQIITVTPITGLNYTIFTPITEGYYEIFLTPISAGTYSIVLSASLLNHETRYTTFTLTASGIPTILTSLPSSKTVAVNQTFVLQLRFQDESYNAIDTATITLINPPSGLLVSGAVPAGNGLYNITIQALEIKTFDLLFRASKDNYQSSSAGFTLVVTEIQTFLRFAGDITSSTIPFSETYELIVYYEQTEPTVAVQGASITLLPTDITDLEIHVTEYTGYYLISIRGHAIRSWILSVVANKTDYRIATKQFLIEVERIDTTVQGSSPLEALLVGQSYAFTFNYIIESNSSYVHGASVLSSGEGADWISYLELGSGQYSVNLTPQELGEHFVILTFERTGFETASYRLTFAVERVPITVEVLQGLSAPELSQSTIVVKLSEEGTGSPVSGVQVFCYIIDPNGAPSESIPMDETSIAGEYSALISMPAAEGVYLLQITCDAENYVLESAYSVQLQPGRDALTMLWVTTTRYYPFMILLAALGVGLVYRRRYRRRRIRENKEALAVKRRFDGVKSLLGVIVLHKESGLPVYSKILRLGLEETVISAFITAITSFRGEFDIESDSGEWGLIPISDIVRVISTNRLVCAFITTGNPSPEQRERLIRFAKTVAFIFDETLHDVPIIVLDKHTKTQFDTLFEDILDGALLRTYKLDEAKKFPTNTCALEKIARKQGVEFKLEELASEIATCGLEEGRVYKAIMTALENHYLVTTDESPFTANLIRASETVEDES